MSVKKSSFPDLKEHVENAMGPPPTLLRVDIERLNGFFTKIGPSSQL